jgi:Transposase protein
MALASTRRQAAARLLENLEESFTADDTISSLSLPQIEHKLNDEPTLPNGFCLYLMDTTLLISFIKLDNGIPKISANINLNSNLDTVVSLNNVHLPITQYRYLCPEGKVTYLSQLVNLMARIKALNEQPCSTPPDTNIDMAVAILETSLEQMDGDDDEQRRLKFMIEQLKLASQTKFARVYSPQQLIFSYRLHAASPAAYRVLQNEDVLYLPSITTLKKVTRKLNQNTGLDNTSYLKLWLPKPNQFDRNVLTMIDEIYVAKRVEYSSGTIQGLTADGKVASTLLCFMIKSVSSKYRDLVSMYLMAKLTAEKLGDCFKEVLSFLHSLSFNVMVAGRFITG